MIRVRIPGGVRGSLIGKAFLVDAKLGMVSTSTAKRTILAG